MRTLVVTGTLVASLVGLAPAADAATPSPVSDLQLSSKDGVVYVDWTSSPDTTSADVCRQADTPPATPTDPGATCSGAVTTSGFSFSGTAGQAYGVSVFAYDSGSDSYSSPTSGTITAVDAPPAPPRHLRTYAYGDHGMHLEW